MPLTLNWNCARNCGATQCYLEFTSNYSAPGAVGASGYIDFIATPAGDGFTIVNPPNGFNSAAIGPGILDPAVFPTISIGVRNDASTNQADFANPAVWTFTNINLRIDYTCTDPVSGLPVKSMSFHLTPGGGGHAACITGGETRSTVDAGGGGAVAKLWKSTPLGDCNGSSVNMGGFGGAPPNPSYPLPPGGLACLCASGGTPPYTYSQSFGRLPAGQTLDTGSGCIMGTPTGGPGGSGTPVVGFAVADSVGGNASTSVAFGPPVTMIPAQMLAVVPLPDPKRCSPCKGRGTM